MKKNCNCSRSSPANIQINQNSTDTHGFEKQAPEGAFKTTIKGILMHAIDNTGCICVNQSCKIKETNLRQSSSMHLAVQCVY